MFNELILDFEFCNDYPDVVVVSTTFDEYTTLKICVGRTVSH